MTENPAADPPDPPDSSGSAGRVELLVPASSAFVSVLRSVTVGLAARCDLTLDEIEDLRIAIDEACALLLPLATPGSDLVNRFELSAGQLEITTSVDARPGVEPNRDGFGWTVLQALASEVDVTNAGATITIRLTKRREPAQP